MATLRSVHGCTLFAIVFSVIFTRSIFAVEESHGICDSEWFVSVNEEVTVSWSGDDRDVIVTANITTTDTHGQKCDSNMTLKAEFRTKKLSLANPCSNALYYLAVSFDCNGKILKQNAMARTPPGAPTIERMDPTNVSIAMSWTPPPGKIESYVIMLEGGGKKRPKYSRKEETSGTSMTFEGLDPYTMYNATVAARNEDHLGKWSSPKAVRTFEGVPFEPENLRIVDKTSTKIVLEWDEPEQETGYILRYQIQWNENGTSDASTGESETASFTIDQLFPYSQYHISVAAVNSVGVGRFAHLTEITKLAVPDAPKLEILEVTNVSVSLKWGLSTSYRGPEPTYSLHLERKGGDEHYDIDLGGSSTDNQHTVKHLKPFTTYEIIIRARNDVGFGPYSSMQEFLTKIGVPSPPRNLKVVSKSSTAISISWDVPSPANGPIVKYMIGWKTKSKDQKTDYTYDTSFDLTGLAPYTEYDFKVSAKTEVDWGNWSATFRVRTDVSVPSEPLNLRELEVTNVSINIEWSTPEYRNGPHMDYVIRWRKVKEVEEDDGHDFDYYFVDIENGTSKSELWNIDEVNTTTYEIQNLDSYSNYSVQVCGKTSAGLGNYTDPLIMQTTAGIPSYPDKTKVSKVLPTSLFLQWSTPKLTNGPLDGYVLIWGVIGTDGSLTRTTNTSYSALGLRPYTEYFFKIAAETKGGIGPFSSIFKRTAISTPGAPKDLMPSSVTDRCILLNWLIPEHPNAPYVQYTVKWRELSAESSTQAQETNLTSYRIRDLAAETNYSIRVRGWTEVGEGPWTESLYVRTRKKDHSSSIIAGSVAGSLFVLFIIAGVVLFFLAKKRGGIKHLIASKPAVKSVDNLQIDTISVPLETINHSIEKIGIQNFDQHVLQLMANGYSKLGEEFERLTRESPAFPTTEAKKNDNLTKNRWVKILPFDHSRVKLRPIGDETEPDFINASYVPGDSYLLEYIATQGPLPNTINDFWKMVWQESVFLMVMLTQCVERAKRTCERYWPAAGTTNKYGDLEVQSVSESITPAYIQRLFLVTQDGKQRHIVHLHYMNWPVSGCPKSPDDFLSFVRTVRGQVPSAVTGPMLVHCSAGIGRTGTFIAVDRLTQQMNRSCDEIDVYGTVLEMRKYRFNLVQTEEQYYFIYLCVQRILQERRQEINDDYGGGIYSN